MGLRQDPLLSELDQQIAEAAKGLWITRCSDLQQRKVESLAVLRDHIDSRRQEARSEKREDRANLLLGYQCLAESLIAELRMWIGLKRGDPDAAWNDLVVAQQAASAARRAHARFAQLEDREERLDVIEQVVFPPQVFMSIGGTATAKTCSVCDRDYESCDHIAGRPYNGELCFSRIEALDLDHVAIVDVPADKHCRVTEFEVEGGRRNRMTWRIER